MRKCGGRGLEGGKAIERGGRGLGGVGMERKNVEREEVNGWNYEGERGGGGGGGKRACKG